MKRMIVLGFACVVMFLAAAPASATQTWGYYAWRDRFSGEIYCGPECCGPIFHYYYTYELVGTRTVYCDGSESTTGDTSCDRDVQPLDAEPCP